MQFSASVLTILNLQVAVDLIDLKFSPLNTTSGSFGAVSALKENGKVVIVALNKCKFLI